MGAIVIACIWLGFVAWIGSWRIEHQTALRIAVATEQTDDIAAAGARALQRRFETLRTIPELLADQERFGRSLAVFDALSETVPSDAWGGLLDTGELRVLSLDLAELALHLNVGGIHLVDSSGYVIASSDGFTAPTRLGTTLSNLEAFGDALVIGRGEEFAVDAVSGKPTFYFAHRVDAEGAVIVVTTSDRLLPRVDRGPEAVLVSDPNDVVVISSDNALLFDALAGAAVNGMTPDDLQRRYRRTDFDVLPANVIAESVDEMIATETIHRSARLPVEDLEVHVIAPMVGLRDYRHENMLVAGGLGVFGLLLTAVVAMALLQIGAMRERAIRDPLTGLSNRRYADEVLPRLLELDDRGRLAGFTLVSFDLDRFKQVNDTWGHPVGDRVLRRFARIALQSARRSDLVFRLGGEEFVTVLVEEDVAGAVAYAERVRAAAEAIDDLDPVPPGRITVSAGVAKRHEGESLEGLLKRSDGLLYRAKESGRNRIECDDAV